MMHDDAIAPGTGILAPPKYRCPVHGEVDNHISSTIPGIEGVWCQICALEQLDKLGVCRLEEINPTPSTALKEQSDA